VIVNVIVSTNGDVTAAKSLIARPNATRPNETRPNETMLNEKKTGEMTSNVSL
jgi:hypothetical protein